MYGCHCRVVAPEDVIACIASGILWLAASNFIMMVSLWLWDYYELDQSEVSAVWMTSDLICQICLAPGRCHCIFPIIHLLVYSYSVAIGLNYDWSIGWYVAVVFVSLIGYIYNICVVRMYYVLCTYYYLLVRTMHDHSSFGCSCHHHHWGMLSW